MGIKLNPFTGQFDLVGVTTVPPGSGDVVGPASSTDDAITRYDGTTGKLIQNSNATLDDSGNIVTLGDITANGISLSQTITGVTNSNTIDLTKLINDISADVKFSSDSAPVNETKINLSSTVSGILATLDDLIVEQLVFVNKTLSATVGNGTINKPFRSLKEMYDTILDAGDLKRYISIIAPGSYDEVVGTVAKPYIHLMSPSKDAVLIRVSDGIGGFTSLKWNTSNPGRLYLTNISIINGFELVNDNPLSGGCILELNACTLNNGLIFNGRGGGSDFITIKNGSDLFTNTVIHSAETNISDSNIYGTLQMDDVGCTIPDSFGSAITASIKSNYIFDLLIESTTYDVYTDLWACNSLPTVTINTNSAFPCTLNLDANSYPNSLVLTGSPSAVIGLSTRSEGVAYTPAISGDWSPVPNDVKDALDQLADRVSNTASFANIFNSTSDWTGPAGGSYILTYLKTLHNKDNPIVQLFELNGSDYIQVEAGVRIDTSENVIITVNSTPDLRFVGKIVIS